MKNVISKIFSIILLVFIVLSHTICFAATKNYPEYNPIKKRMGIGWQRLEIFFDK